MTDDAEPRYDLVAHIRAKIAASEYEYANPAKLRALLRSPKLAEDLRAAEEKDEPDAEA